MENSYPGSKLLKTHNLPLKQLHRIFQIIKIVDHVLCRISKNYTVTSENSPLTAIVRLQQLDFVELFVAGFVVNFVEQVLAWITLS